MGSIWTLRDFNMELRSLLAKTGRLVLEPSCYLCFCLAVSEAPVPQCMPVKHIRLAVAPVQNFTSSQVSSRRTDLQNFQGTPEMYPLGCKRQQNLDVGTVE